MITASHNPPADNGIKIVDSDGGMLSQTWEPYAEDVANSDPSSLYPTLQEICSKEGLLPLKELTR
jgi:phosphoacetylglucosamine mutase